MEMNLQVLGDRQPLLQRVLAVSAFSFLFAYLLSVLFEGQVLYDLMGRYNVDLNLVVTLIMVAHLAGLICGGILVNSLDRAKRILLLYVGVCLLASIAFFWPPAWHWWVAGPIAGFSAGCAIAAWGHYFRLLSASSERLRFCADCLIGTYLLFPAINLISSQVSPFLALALAMGCLVLGAVCLRILAASLAAKSNGSQSTAASEAASLASSTAAAPSRVQPLSCPETSDFTQAFGKALVILCLFTLIVPINAGLLYQAIAPAFTNWSSLNGWYPSFPYIAAVLVLRLQADRIGRSLRAGVLYIGLSLLILALIAYISLDRSVAAYLTVVGLMTLGLGVLDLFWWSILGVMLDFTANPARLLGIGLAANVLGVLLGHVLGAGFTALGLSASSIAVAALVVVCIALIVLPMLNNELLHLLHRHAFVTSIPPPDQPPRSKVQPRNPLTERENDVLQQILAGKSNREIGTALFISENTVKTHARSLYTKYDVNSRAELISLLLQKR